MQKISDLVYVPPVRTVMRMADLKDTALRRSIVEDFILTGETAFTLYTLLDKIGAGQGQGFFVTGNYGSGKSHLLTVISMLLNDRSAREVFLNSLEDKGEDASGYGTGRSDLLPSPILHKSAALNPLTVEISLVEHSNREYLEEIVLNSCHLKLRSLSATANLREEWTGKTRVEAFRLLHEALKEGGYGGLVLLIDELSEFLRSKPTAQNYNEDVRFLQYMGEFAGSMPAWIVATLQENIEDTGTLAGEVLHKIKDRYPVRFRLTGQHVKEIISRRLVRQKETAREFLPQLYTAYLNSFQALPFSRQEFFDLYPVHPLTVLLLDDLRTLFSQHRGVVDFIHYRLAGDSRRGITPFMEKPAEHLLTPDYIFDHFRDRIRETVESRAYSEEVFRYFEREISNIFPDEEDAATALRLVKLLILGNLAPVNRRFSAREMADMLLYRYLELESQVNYDYIEELLQTLVLHGAYVVSGSKEKGIGERTTRVYYIDLQADINLLVKKKLEHVESQLLAGDERIILSLLPWLEEPHLPLKDLQATPEQEKEIKWQCTRRKGKIMFDSLENLTPARLETMEEELKYTETDFIFFVSVPYYNHEHSSERGVSPYLNLGHSSEGGVSPYLNRQQSSPRDLSSFPAQSTAAAGWAIPPRGDQNGEQTLSSLALWLPQAISSSAEKELRLAYAYLLLQEEYASDNSTVGQQVKEHLTEILKDQKRKVREIFRDLYNHGRLKVAAGRSINPVSLGYLSFNDLVSEVAKEILNKRFPRHCEIQPQAEVTGSYLQRALVKLSSSHLDESEVDKQYSWVLTDFLQPMGLLKKKGKEFMLEINPKKSSLVDAFLTCLPEKGRVKREEVFQKLRKGPFGLSKEGFLTLGVAMVLSGAVSAYLGGRRQTPTQINYYSMEKIEELGPGTLIRAELQDVLAEVFFLPEKLSRLPLTFASQQAAWEHIISFKGELEQRLKNTAWKISSLRDNRLFQVFDWRKLEKITERLLEFLTEIKISFTSQEGLERFLVAYQASPFIAGDLEKIEELENFLEKDLESMLRLHLYMHDGQLFIPSADKYQSLNGRRRILNQLLEEEDILFKEKLRARIFREFKIFQDEYSTLYLTEHRQALSPEVIQPYRSLLDSPAYRLLEHLSRINAPAFQEDIVAVNRTVLPVLEKECGAPNIHLLQERPLCPCGFQLGWETVLPLVSALEAKIHQGIRNCLAALQQKERKKPLKGYLDNLEAVGRRHETTSLDKLLQLSPADPALLEKLTPCLNRNVVEHLNKALTGDAIIAERSLGSLEEILVGRVFTVEQLENLFRQWIQGQDGNKPHYIRVAGRSAMERDAFSFAEGSFSSSTAHRLAPLRKQLRDEEKHTFKESVLYTQSDDEKDRALSPLYLTNEEGEIKVVAEKWGTLNLYPSGQMLIQSRFPRLVAVLKDKSSPRLFILALLLGWLAYHGINWKDRQKWGSLTAEEILSLAARNGQDTVPARSIRQERKERKRPGKKQEAGGSEEAGRSEEGGRSEEAPEDEIRVENKTGGKESAEDLIGAAGHLLNLEDDLWKGHEEMLFDLGESIFKEKEFIKPAFLEELAAMVEEKVTQIQLWELYLKLSTAFHLSPYNFDTLLKVLGAEPLFPGIVEEAGRRLLLKLQSEEITGTLKASQESIREARKLLHHKRGDGSAQGIASGARKAALLQKKEQMLSLLEKTANCHGMLLTVQKASRQPPDSNHAWEKFYRQVSAFELEIATLKELARPLADRATLFLERWWRSYTQAAEAIAGSFENWEKEMEENLQHRPPGNNGGKSAPRRNSLAWLLEKFPKWFQKKRYTGGGYLLLLDGARLDIWEALMEKILSELKLSFLQDGFTWAALPTVTETQLQPLKDAGLLGQILNVDEGVISELAADPTFLLQESDNRQQLVAAKEKRGAFKAIKLDFIDDKLHTSREDLLTLVEETLLQAKKKLWPVMENIPGEALILVAADHGFRTNFHYSKSSKWEEARYLHGKATCFEVLAPWILLEKR